jgi:beta-lactam-binding protein with PASTA domain
MALDAINAIGALVILRRRKIDTQQRVFGTVGAALLPGIVGLAVPLIIAQQTKGQQSPAKNLVAVPDLANSDQAAAVASLNQLQLKMQVITVTSADAQKGKVIAQDSPKGTLLSPGATVTITVGAGVARPTQSVVPDLTGESIEDAEKTLESVQLELGNQTNAVSLDSKKDEVVSQDPLAGTLVDLGSEVSVVVGSGQAPPK